LNRSPEDQIHVYSIQFRILLRCIRRRSPLLTFSVLDLPGERNKFIVLVLLHPQPPMPSPKKKKAGSAPAESSATAAGDPISSRVPSLRYEFGLAFCSFSWPLRPSTVHAVQPQPHKIRVWPTTTNGKLHRGIVSLELIASCLFK